jgi:cytochrome c oxidase assembly protein subunit 15
MPTQTLPTEPQPIPTIGAAISTGFFASVLMWMFAWILHLPGVHVPSSVSIVIMLATLFGVCLFWLPCVEAKTRVKTGALAGGIAGLVNLMILGSIITEQPDTTAQMESQANQLQPNALLVIVGSLAVSTVIAVVASLISKSSKHPPIDAIRWRTRFARVTALSYIPLIAVGGLVTSTDSALAVPDGATTYGALSVLFPLKLMAEPRIFFEHSHRLFGTLAGLTTLVLMLRVLRGERRKFPKVMTSALFLAVLAQGLMGAFRVSEESTFLAIFHGIFAQIVLALSACTAITLSKRWVSCNPSPESLPLAKRTRTFMALAFSALFLQLCLGAVTRHLNSNHAMLTHAGFAFIVVGLLIIGGSFCIKAGKSDPGSNGIRPFGAIMHGLVVLQFTLGWAVLGMAWDGDEAADLPTSTELSSTAAVPASEALITTVHHLTGAMLFAATACALFWALRIALNRKIG